MLEISVGEAGEIVLSGRLDASEAMKAETFMTAVTESRSLDLQGLQYISSAGLGVLLATQKRLMETGHSLKLINVRGHIREVFHYSGLERVFEIEPKTQP
jgi:anti-sigma B factor antagonist